MTWPAGPSRTGTASSPSRPRSSRVPRAPTLQSSKPWIQRGFGCTWRPGRRWLPCWAPPKTQLPGRCVHSGTVCSCTGSELLGPAFDAASWKVLPGLHSPAAQSRPCMGSDQAAARMQQRISIACSLWRSQRAVPSWEPCPKAALIRSRQNSASETGSGRICLKRCVGDQVRQPWLQLRLAARWLCWVHAGSRAASRVNRSCQQLKGCGQAGWCSRTQ